MAMQYMKHQREQIVHTAGTATTRTSLTRALRSSYVGATITILAVRECSASTTTMVTTTPTTGSVRSCVFRVAIKDLLLTGGKAKARDVSDNEGQTFFVKVVKMII